MDKIRLLPDTVANQIAAGEVIQRPAAVIKELVENSIDAGATLINVLVVNAGKTSIQVIDNGTGMSSTDARLAFERHATSKIRQADDLFSLHTMGFRGEALPSIASVAQVTLKTRQANEPLGTCIHIEGGKLVSQEADACPQGSNFLVENLFYVQPVRRRFLKSNAAELNNIITAFQRIALVYPEVAFTLHSNGQELLNLRATNTHQRIVDIFGKKINQALLPVNVETSLGSISGFVGTPESAHKKNLQQYFFVNGRFMKHGSFHKAVISAYDRLIPQGEQVPYFIYFNVDPGNIDVNIHPTKTEIKFDDESAVWQILYAAVRDAVGRNNRITAIDFDTEGRPDLPVIDTEDDTDVKMPVIDYDPQYNPFNGGNSGKSASSSPKGTARPKFDSSAHIKPVVSSDWQSLYDGIELEDNTTSAKESNHESSLFGQDDINDSVFAESSLSSSSFEVFSSPFTDRSTTHLQYKGSYILTSVNAGLMVTDQERAHERILFEQYMKDMENMRHASQKVLFPEIISFTPTDMVSLPSILPEMEALGFELTDLGDRAFAINAVPAGLEGTNIVSLVNDMVNSAIESISGATPSGAMKELHTSLAISMASNSAIPHGQVLSNEEMEKLISDLSECENSSYTPKGQPIYQIIPHEQVAF